MKARFFRSDAMAERHGEIDEIIVESEWFQLTYNGLRKAPDGDHIASFDVTRDVWCEETTGEVFSDVVIYDDTQVYVTRTGKVLTDADVDRLSDEAALGYDVAHLVEQHD